VSKEEVEFYDDEKKIKSDMISAIKDAQKTIDEEDDEEESEENRNR
jgi:hypothetical protein